MKEQAAANLLNPKDQMLKLQQGDRRGLLNGKKPAKRIETEVLALKDRLAAELADTKRLHQLSSRLLSETELIPLLHEVLKASVDLMEADKGTLQLYDERENALKLVAHLGFNPDILEHFKTVPADPSINGTALQHRERVIVEDALIDPHFSEMTPAYLKLGLSSVHSIPLIASDGKFLGIMSNHFDKPRRPAERELQLLELFAQQAVRVIERKRSEQIMAERANTQSVLYRFTDRLHRANSLSEIYDAALNAILNALKCQRASILIFDEAAVMRFESWCGLSESYRNAVEGHSPWKPDEKDPQPVCINDIETADVPESLKQVVRSEGIRALVFVPLLANGKFLGKFMAYFDAPHVFRNEEIELSLAIARQLAVGVERKRAEEALRSSKQRLQTALDAGNMGAWEWDISSGKVIWSPGLEKIHGLKPGTFGGTFDDFKRDVHPDDMASVLEKIQRAVESPHDYHIIHRIIRPDGVTRWLEGFGRFLFDAEGHPQKLAGVCMDVTDEKLAEEKLEATVAERTIQLRDTVAELETFSYTIAHDMRAPLRAITGFSRLLEEDFSAELSGEGKDYVRRIAVSTQRLDRLIQDVLNYSRISRSEIQLESVDVEKLTREIIETHSHLQEHGTTILVQSPMPRVIANDAALTQCIYNLLSNAVKFVSPDTKPQIRIWAELQREDYVRLWFEDNGIGISEEGQEKIFHMFERLHPVHQYEGTGIGLSIVRKAIEKIDGRIGVESKVGVGSRFWLELKQAD